MILWGRPAPVKQRSPGFGGFNNLHFEPLSAVFSASRICAGYSKRQRNVGWRDRGHFCSSTRSTASTGHNRTVSFLCGGRHGYSCRRHHGESVFRAEWRIVVAVSGAGAEQAGSRGARNNGKRAEEETGQILPLSEDARRTLCAMADGDGRYLLNLVEEVGAIAVENPMDVAELTERLQKRAPLYDKSQEAHYNLISALHKSLRVPTWTRPCTGLHGCWTEAKIRDTSPAAQRALRWRISAWPTQMHYPSRLPRGKRLKDRLAGGSWRSRSV